PSSARRRSRMAPRSSTPRTSRTGATLKASSSAILSPPLPKRGRDCLLRQRIVPVPADRARPAAVAALVAQPVGPVAVGQVHRPRRRLLDLQQVVGRVAGVGSAVRAGGVGGRDQRRTGLLPWLAAGSRYEHTRPG